MRLCDRRGDFSARLLARLETTERILNILLMIVGGAAVLALMVVGAANIITRIFGHPISWAYEVISFLGAVVIAFALGTTQKRKDHIAVNIITHRFPKKVNRAIDGFTYLLTALFFGIVSRQVFRLGMNIMRSGEVSETLKKGYHYFVFCVAVGFAVLSFTLILDFISVFRKAESAEAPGEPSDEKERET
jgi:TRAP-type C4-dicarboxylate transport system permease small subunit